jgi:hypothetical protein
VGFRDSSVISSRFTTKVTERLGDRKDRLYFEDALTLVFSILRVPSEEECLHSKVDDYCIHLLKK